MSCSDLKRLDQSYLKKELAKHQLDPHKFKKRTLPAGTPLSRYDVYRKGRELWLMTKDGKECLQTGYFT